MKANLFSILLMLCLSVSAQQKAKHVFILSGQSNMMRLDPNLSFTPKIESHFGKENVVIVKNALGGKPIRRWYKKWKAPKNKPEFTASPDLYDSLMNHVKPAIKKIKIASVTFIWMQGEKDAGEGLGKVYKKSLIGLHKQLSKDLGQKPKEVNFIIGRLSDFGLYNNRYVHWKMLRKIQEQVGESKPHFDWVNTDDCNSGKNIWGKMVENDLHMSIEGYKIMGKRFALKAIELIEK